MPQCSVSMAGQSNRSPWDRVYAFFRRRRDVALVWADGGCTGSLIEYCPAVLALAEPAPVREHGHDQLV